MKDKKPEWFEIAEKDATSQSPVVKPRRSISTIAIVATLAILGTGAVVAQISEEEEATAETPALTAGKVSGTTTPSTTGSATSVKAVVAAPAESTTPAPQAATPANPTAPANPSAGGVANPMTNGGGRGDDDERGEHEGFEDGDDDHPRPAIGKFGKHGPRPPHREEGEGDDD